MSELLHVTFICSGNICRSPMAEKMFAHQISERGLTDEARLPRARATTSERLAASIDRLAALVEGVDGPAQRRR